jgi:hypothetical protein
MYRLYRDLVFSETLSTVYKKTFGSQPEDGFMKKVETCRCYNFLIIIELYLHNNGWVRLWNYIYCINYWKHNKDVSSENQSRLTSAIYCTQILLVLRAILTKFLWVSCWYWCGIFIYIELPPSQSLSIYDHVCFIFHSTLRNISCSTGSVRTLRINHYTNNVI